MQLGFVIDQSRCIGCHACTVACKAENDVPVGDFRTWVKYTEEGEFPAVKRSFAILRCNQCSAAPCMEICPVNALAKLPNGIVDVDPAACIGCKSCMHGCPYDALYIGSNGTAEKCHFCAHRVEVGLAPACAVVCPTEAIIPGDFDDPRSVVSRMRSDLNLTARKPEAGTQPNVLYRDAQAAGLDPGLTSAAGGSLWADRNPAISREVQEFEALEERARAKTSYNVEHAPLWGGKVTGYLVTKSVSAGVALAAGLSEGGTLVEDGSFRIDPELLYPAVGILFLAVTLLLLVMDLKRPERFLYILLRPNWSSWLVRGSYALMIYGALLGAWLTAGLLGVGRDGPLREVFVITTAAAGALAACYTGWLFGQAKGRVLWMRRGLWFHLIVQALVAGAATLLLLSPITALDSDHVESMSRVLAMGLMLHTSLLLTEGLFSPKGRAVEYARAHRLILFGPFAKRHWWLGLGVGIVIPLALLCSPLPPDMGLLAAVLALVGLYVEEDILVRAGQALSIS